MAKARGAGMVGELTELLAVLRYNGVQKYENQTVKIEFNERAFLENPVIEHKDEVPSANQKQNDEDDLYWSGK